MSALAILRKLRIADNDIPVFVRGSGRSKGGATGHGEMAEGGRYMLKNWGLVLVAFV